MEDTHWEGIDYVKVVRIRLNPCFNGRYSLRVIAGVALLKASHVLILVLMEDTHWVTQSISWIIVVGS